MIRSFRSKGLKLYADRGDRSKLSIVKLRRLDTILKRLMSAEVAEDMNIPG